MKLVAVGERPDQGAGQHGLAVIAGEAGQRIQRVALSGVIQGIENKPLKSEMLGTAAGCIDAAHGGNNG